MSKMKLVLLVAVLTGASLAAAEEPPYQRLLQGEDAKKAVALDKRIDELWAEGKFAEAAAPAAEVLALRQRVQGEKHYEAADAAQRVQTLRQAAALPAEQRAALAAAPGLNEKAEALFSRGKYGEAEPLFRQALAVWDEALGPKHPDTAISYNNLAGNLQGQGRVSARELMAGKPYFLSDAIRISDRVLRV
jgi:tetratricopeptide (TPR) repeat protein